MRTIGEPVLVEAAGLVERDARPSMGTPTRRKRMSICEPGAC